MSAISAYALGGGTALSAAGTGTAVGSTAAAIKGGGLVSLGTQPVTLTYDGAHPALYISQGTLSLAGNAFTVNGPALASGTYPVVQQAGGGIIASGNFPAVTGTAIDGSHLGTISVSGGSVNLVVDQPPVAGPDGYSRAPGVGIKIQAGDLLANDTDADGDTLSFVSCDAATANGVALGTSGNGNGTVIVYPSSAANRADSFHYTVSDGNGGTAIGTVSITINPVVTGQRATITVNGGVATMTFFGVPACHYVVQRSPDLHTWSDITVSAAAAGIDDTGGYSVVTAPGGGAFTVADHSAPGSPAFYQLRAAP